MSDPGLTSRPGQNDENDPPSRGPNLVLAYSLIALALLVAMAAAALIVWPFYKGR
jgi:hypothetical protein